MVKSVDMSLTAAKIPTTISIALDTTLVVPPSDVIVSGYLNEAPTGLGIPLRVVRVMVSKDAGEFTEVATVVTSFMPIGYYAVTLTISEPGAYVIYTEFLGDATYEGCEEKTEVRPRFLQRLTVMRPQLCAVS